MLARSIVRCSASRLTVRVCAVGSVFLVRHVRERPKTRTSTVKSAKLYSTNAAFNSTKIRRSLTARSKPLVSYFQVGRCRMSTETPQQAATEQHQNQTPIEPSEAQVIPFWAKILGAAGLIPFVAGAVGPFVLPMEAAGQVVLMQMTYGATILAFLGAPHWGFAISEFKRADLPQLTSSHQAFRYVWGVVPQLFSWFCLCSPPWHGALGLLVGLTGAFVVDTYAARAGLVPTWYPRLRLPLTMGAVLSVGITWMQLM